MLFSRPWGYAIRALIYLAEHKEEGPILSLTIARATGIPSPYLVKILGTLANAEIVYSIRGPGGGFGLLLTPNKIRLIDILLPFENIELFHECIIGLGACGDNDECPVHQLWAEPKKHLVKFLEDHTLADMVRLKLEHPKDKAKKSHKA
jgi:Rrf2 family protein